jgi:hypothetical protein
MNEKKQGDLEQQVIGRIENEFHEFKMDSDRSCIGQQDQFDIEFDGKTYGVICDMFWEKADHYDYVISGNGLNIEGCGDFW